MTLSRADAVAELGARLSGWLPLAGLVAVDSPASLGGVVDDALRALGVPETGLAAATIADADVRAFRALSTYYGLLLIRDKAGPLVDIDASGIGVSKKRSQAGLQLDARIERARGEAATWLDAVDGELYSGRLRLDILEPVRTGLWR